MQSLCAVGDQLCCKRCVADAPVLNPSKARAIYNPIDFTLYNRNRQTGANARRRKNAEEAIGTT